MFFSARDEKIIGTFFGAIMVTLFHVLYSSKKFDIADASTTTLTLSEYGNFRSHSKIWCLNFKPQYLHPDSGLSAKTCMSRVSDCNSIFREKACNAGAFRSLQKLMHKIVPCPLRVMKQICGKVFPLQ